MKNLMLVVNSIIFVGSLVGIAWHIICGQFGIAWIAAAWAAIGLLQWICNRRRVRRNRKWN